MQNNAALLKLYREEKALVIGENPTGLEPFPSFKEWRRQYAREYAETHVTVPVHIADALAEAAQAELDKLGLANELEGQASVENTNLEEEKEMNEETTTTVEDVTPTSEPAPKKTAPKRKTATRKAAPKKKAAKKPATKTDGARKLFEKHYGSKPRGEIIKLFVEKVGLTANGAATYYQKFKKAADAS